MGQDEMQARRDGTEQRLAEIDETLGRGGLPREARDALYKERGGLLEELDGLRQEEGKQEEGK